MRFFLVTLRRAFSIDTQLFRFSVVAISVAFGASVVVTKRCSVTEDQCSSCWFIFAEKKTSCAVIRFFFASMPCENNLHVAFLHLLSVYASKVLHNGVHAAFNVSINCTADAAMTLCYFYASVFHSILE